MPQPIIRAGYLRHRLTLQDKVVVQNDYGEETITWSTTATVWGTIEPLRGREYMEARQEQANISHRVRMRHGPTVKPTMRILNDGRVFEIESVINPLERNRCLELRCREEIDI